jgi:hypothetical protein
MSLKELREGRINSRDKRKGRNIFVAAIEFLTKNKRIETDRTSGRLVLRLLGEGASK